MHVLVTGGAGYVGSHAAKCLARNGCQPVVLDNLCRGHRRAVRWGPLIEADLADPAALDHAFNAYPIEAVLHFAAFAYVGESMSHPGMYFNNNVAGTLNLLEAMRAHRVGSIVFSSSCATYGIPDRVPIREQDPQRPVNPYGESKLMVERILRWYGTQHGLRWTALRYFNAAGADPEGEIGEQHDDETHLIPNAIAAARGELPALPVFGSDYPTPDGTAVRDYTHVTDLAEAHLLALTRMREAGASAAFNLGTGSGRSVREVIRSVEAVAGRPVPTAVMPRREGDPPELVADPTLARTVLGWQPRHSSLEEIAATAWNWSSLVREPGTAASARR